MRQKNASDNFFKKHERYPSPFLSKSTLQLFKPIKVETGTHRKTLQDSEAAHRLTVLWKTTLWPLPTLSMWVARFRQMALWRIASMVWASKKSWGLAGGGEGQSQMRAESNKHNTRVPTVALIYKNSMAFPSRSVTNHNYVRIVSWLKNAIPLWFLNVALQQQKLQSQ